MRLARADSDLGARTSTLPLRPCLLAGTRSEVIFASTYGIALIVVLVLEILTPNDVVASLAFLPVIAAMWTLSTRLAYAFGLAAAVVFGVILASEVGNRPTVMIIGAVGAVIAVTVRVYAVKLAHVLSVSQRAWPAGMGHSGWLAMAPSEGIDSLTRREFEVAKWASRGYTAVEIANQLHISERTVESHLANTYAKLAIHSRSALRRLGGRLSD